MADTFGTRLARLRKEHGWEKQEQLAAVAGVKRPGTVSDWETGKTFPRVDQLLLMAEALGVQDLHWLLTGEERGAPALGEGELSRLVADVQTLLVEVGASKMPEATKRELLTQLAGFLRQWGRAIPDGLRD